VIPGPKGIRALEPREIQASVVLRAIRAQALRAILVPLVLRVIRVLRAIPASLGRRETQGPKVIPV